MKYKILFLTILITVLTTLRVCSAQREGIQSFVPQPLIELFDAFSKIKIDFSKVASGFRHLTGGLENFSNWLQTHIGLNILFIIKKIGELFVWILEGIANLIKIGLSFIK